MGIDSKYQYIYTVLNGNYVVLPPSGTILQIPPEASNDVGRYSTIFAGAAAALPEDFCYCSLKRDKKEPLLAFSKAQKKINCTSSANFAQCAAWDWEESLLRDHFDEILRFGFYSEAQVDRLAEGDKSVPAFGEGEAAGIADFQKIDIADNALRAVLFGVFSRWLLGKAQVKIAVPASEREHYTRYVLSAVREIYSYFPVCLRGEAGFASYVQNGKEQSYPRYSILFVPESMADTRTILLDGSSRTACELYSASTKRENLDRFIEHLASLRDPAARKQFLDTVYEELEKKETAKDTASISARQYAIYGEAMLLKENRGSFDEKAKQWLAFYNNRENYPKTMGDEIDRIAQSELNEKDLLAFAEKCVTDGTGIEQLVEGLSALLPLAGRNETCSKALQALLDKKLKACGDENAETVFRALEKQQDWAATAAGEDYKNTLARWGKVVGNQHFNQTVGKLGEAKAATLFELQKQTAQIVETARKDTAPFLSEEDLTKFAGLLIEQQQKALNAEAERRLNAIAPVTGNNADLITARKTSLENLKKQIHAMDSSFADKQKWIESLDELIAKEEGRLGNASVLEQTLTNQVMGKENYFEMLACLAAEEERTSHGAKDAYDRRIIENVQKKVEAKRPAGRNAYLSTYQRWAKEALSPVSMGKQLPLVQNQIKVDLKAMNAEPLELPAVKYADDLTDRIADIKKLFGGEKLVFRVNEENYSDRDVRDVLKLEAKQCADEGEKKRLLNLCRELIRTGIFREVHFARLGDMFVEAGMKRTSLLRAITDGSMSGLSKRQAEEFLAAARRDRVEEDRIDEGTFVEELEKGVSDKLPVELFDVCKRYVDDYKRKHSGGKKLAWWQITLIAVLGALIIAAGVFFAVRMLKPEPEPEPEEPVVTPSPLEGRVVNDGYLDFAVSGVEEDELKTRLSEQFDVLGGTAQMPESLFDDEALLKSLGYPVDVNLDGSGLSDLSVLSGAVGMRKLSAAGNPGLTNIAALNGLTRLQELDLRGTGVINDTAEAFSKAHPGCWIVIGGQDAEKVFINGACYTRGDTSWDLKNRGITDLSFLKEQQYSGIFSALQELDLSVNPLRSLAGAENLENLNVLSLQAVQGSYDMLNELNLLQHLSYLRISRNNWSATLLDALTQNVAAEKGFILSVDGDASPADPTTVIIGGKSIDVTSESLDLSGLGLTEESEDLQNLAQFTRLRVLDLSDNYIADASVVANALPQLEWLDISGNRLQTIEPFGKLQKLHTLYVQGNPIEKLEFRDGQFTALKELTIGDKYPIDLSYLIYMRVLEYLDVRTAAEITGLESAVAQHNTLKVILRSDSLVFSEEFRAELQEKGILLLPAEVEAERPQPEAEQNDAEASAGAAEGENETEGGIVPEDGNTDNQENNEAETQG